MRMVFCRGCGKEIHETAPTCPHCGSTQNVSTNLVTQSSHGSPWLAIASLVLGIICTLALFDESEWDTETAIGLAMFAAIGLVIGSISIANYDSGKGMAITGVVLSSISLLLAIGNTFN